MFWYEVNPQFFESARNTCVAASDDSSMAPIAQIGFASTLLELTATSIGEGIVAGGFIAAVFGMLAGRSRKELEDSAMRNGFWGGLGGISCLCLDLLVRYAV